MGLIGPSIINTSPPGHCPAGFFAPKEPRMPTLHPYTIHCAGQKVTVLAPTAWHALDHGMIIFGHLGGISVKRQGAAGGAA